MYYKIQLLCAGTTQAPPPIPLSQIKSFLHAPFLKTLLKYVVDFPLWSLLSLCLILCWCLSCCTGLIYCSLLIVCEFLGGHCFLLSLEFMHMLCTLWFFFSPVLLKSNWHTVHISVFKKSSVTNNAPVNILIFIKSFSSYICALLCQYVCSENTFIKANHRFPCWSNG